MLLESVEELEGAQCYRVDPDVRKMLKLSSSTLR